MIPCCYSRTYFCYLIFLGQITIDVASTIGVAYQWGTFYCLLMSVAMGLFRLALDNDLAVGCFWLDGDNGVAVECY